MRYGIISDIHTDPRMVAPMIGILKSEGADKLVLNGDIQETQDTLKDTQDYLAVVLTAVGKSGLEAYVQPGSHEIFPGFWPVVEYFADRFDNILSISRAVRVEQGGHHAVFLPGSDACKGEFVIGVDLPTGRYLRTSEGVMPLADAKEANAGRVLGFLSYQNIGDLKGCVKDPGKTVVFCHVPRKFSNLEEAVDMAELGIATDSFVVSITRYKDGEVQIGSILRPKAVESTRSIRVNAGSLLMKDAAEDFAKAGCPVELRRENRGSDILKEVYLELGITKAVSGHFHESGHRANDCGGAHVMEGELVGELFWNSGCLSNGQAGILTVEGGKVSYRNIRLRDYIKR